MEKAITKDLRCIMMRNKVEIWVEAERIQNLKSFLMKSKDNRFIDINGEVVNTADITGIFSAEVMKDVTRRKNGQWQCDYGYWHERGDKCAHGELARLNNQFTTYDDRGRDN